MFKWISCQHVFLFAGQSNSVQHAFAVMGLIAIVLLAIFVAVLLLLVLGRIRRQRRLSQQNLSRSGEKNNTEQVDPWQEAGQRTTVDDDPSFHRRTDQGYDPDEDDERND